jgi:hypothetical protein
MLFDKITSRIEVRNAHIEPTSAGTPIGGTLNSHLNQELAAFGESSRAWQVPSSKTGTSSCCKPQVSVHMEYYLHRGVGL